MRWMGGSGSFVGGIGGKCVPPRVESGKEAVDLRRVVRAASFVGGNGWIPVGLRRAGG